MKGSKNLVLKKRNCLLYTYCMHSNNPLFQGALVIGSTKFGLKNICIIICLQSGYSSPAASGIMEDLRLSMAAVSTNLSRSLVNYYLYWYVLS